MGELYVDKIEENRSIFDKMLIEAYSFTYSNSLSV